MSSYLRINVLLLLFMLPTSLTAQSGGALSIGDQAPSVDVEFMDTSGRTLTLNEVKEDNGLIVIFSCNTCPWVAKWENRYNTISQIATQNDIGMVALNSNERIRDRGESMAEMRRRAQKMNYTFPYAMDVNHQLADAFGAIYTPEVFLFDGNFNLIYHGAIDDNANSSSAVKNSYLENAISEMLNDEDISVNKTDVVGCSIKRNE